MASMPLNARFCPSVSSGRGSRASAALSGLRKTCTLSVSTNPASTSALNDLAGAPVNSRSSATEACPTAQRVLSSSDCCGAFLRRCSAASAASSAGTARRAISTYLSEALRRPSSRNQSPAGSMARTASCTVQKKRSCIHIASLICSGVSSGSPSSAADTGLSFFSKLLSPTTARTTPSVGLFARPKGTVTRTPGFTAPCSSSGMV